MIKTGKEKSHYRASLVSTFQVHHFGSDLLLPVLLRAVNPSLLHNLDRQYMTQVITVVQMPLVRVLTSTFSVSIVFHRYMWDSFHKTVVQDDTQQRLPQHN